jgi:DNA-directed RNA polymerase specialized sigma24 family protein
MNKHDEVHWRDVQFEPHQWASIPQSAGLWHPDPPDDAAEARLRLAEEMILILQAVLISALTPRQRQVLELYFLENRTQVEIAEALGLTQATVSQHLSGKRRRTSQVGGAFRRIRKAIHKAAARQQHPDTRSAQIFQAMDQLLDQSLTHRRARTLMDALARIENHE